MANTSVSGFAGLARASEPFWTREYSDRQPARRLPLIAPTAAGSDRAIMGLCDLVGTTAAGWMSERFDSRWLLAGYYGLRGLSLLLLPTALAAGALRVSSGRDDSAFLGAGALCLVAAALSLAFRRRRTDRFALVRPLPTPLHPA